MPRVQIPLEALALRPSRMDVSLLLPCIRPAKLKPYLFPLPLLPLVQPRFRSLRVGRSLFQPRQNVLFQRRVPLTPLLQPSNGSSTKGTPRDLDEEGPWKWTILFREMDKLRRCLLKRVCAPTVGRCSEASKVIHKWSGLLVFRDELNLWAATVPKTDKMDLGTNADL